MVLLDGKKLALKLKNSLKKEVLSLSKKMRLAIVLVGDDQASKTFVKLKQRFAKDIDVDTRIYAYESGISKRQLRENLRDIVHEKRNTGVIIQLPLPKREWESYMLNTVIPSKDVDVLSSRAFEDFARGRLRIVPPIVGALKALLDEYAISLEGKKVLLMGRGMLVGKPILAWLLQKGIHVIPVGREGSDLASYAKNADVIISGVGVPKLIMGNMVKKGAIIIDVGTSESQGKLVGDVDFDSVSKQASFITPVLGGIGPLTVVWIFRNLLTLAKK